MAQQTPPLPTRPQHPRIDAPNRAGSYRLVGLPIVVRDANGSAFGLYFRLNRSLRNGRLIDTIDGVRTDNLSGIGYDSSAPGHCYLAYAIGVPSYFGLTSVRPGQVIAVTLAFHYPHPAAAAEGPVSQTLLLGDQSSRLRSEASALQSLMES